MPVLHYGAKSQFISEGVFAHIEVKSNAASGDIRDALSKSVAIKSLAYDLQWSMAHGAIRKNIASFVFAYDCPTKWVDGFFVLRQGYAIVNINGKFGAIDIGEDALLVAFVRIFDALQKNWTAHVDLARYLGDTTAKAF